MSMHDANGEPKAPNTPNAPADPQQQPAEPVPPAANNEAKEASPPRRRGFAMMDRERVKQIASKGGRAAHAAGTAHQFSSAEARVAGKKGGEAPHVRRGGVRRRPSPETSTSPENGPKTEPYSAGAR